MVTPAICKACGESFRHAPHSGGRVRFSLSDEQAVRIEAAKSKRQIGYNDGRYWFCEAHIGAARALKHLPLQEALAIIEHNQNRAHGIEENNPAMGEPYDENT